MYNTVFCLYLQNKLIDIGMTLLTMLFSIDNQYNVNQFTRMKEVILLSISSTVQLKVDSSCNVECHTYLYKRIETQHHQKPYRFVDFL